MKNILLFKKRPKISVIIPVYNAADYLWQCLDTVIHQTLKDIEIILVDDGSTDNSLRICHEYAQKDDRIRVYHQENQGAGIARNTGLKLAKGKYLSFLDADDFFELNMLEKLYDRSFITNSDIVICRSKSLKDKEIESMEWTLKEGFLWKDIFSLDDYFFSEHMFQVCVGWTWDKLFKTSLIKKYNLQFSNTLHSNDLVFCYSAISVAKSITYIKDELIYHRYHSGSLADSQERKPEEFMKAILSLKQKLEELGTYEKTFNSFIKWIEVFSNWHFKSMKNLSSKKEVIDCIEQLNKKIPFNIQNIFRKLGYHYHFPKISVVIPVYNVQKYLDEAIKSALAQTLDDIEIICVNDGSTDNSLNILKKYQRLDPRIKIIDKKNTGYGHSLNVGIQAAEGEYIAILESDDFILPDMYQVLYEKAKKQNLDFVKADYYRFTGEGKDLLKEYIKIADPKDYNRVINPFLKPQICKMDVHTWCGIYKRRFLVRNCILHNETPGARFQDNGFYIKTLCYAKRILLINRAFYMYRHDRPDSSIQITNRLPYLVKEHQLNHQWILSHFYDKVHISMSIYKQVRSFFWAINNDKDKEKAISVTHKILSEAYKRGEIDKDFFSKREWERIEQLLIYSPKHKEKVLSLFQK